MACCNRTGGLVGFSVYVFRFSGSFHFADLYGVFSFVYFARSSGCQSSHCCGLLCRVLCSSPFHNRCTSAMKLEEI